jgi:CheY-like chemotaxis protein
MIHMNERRILIVDDEAGFTRLLRLNLSCTGRYTVRAENNALEAWRAVHEFHPDLILLDVMMPGLDGGDIAAQLQTEPTTRHIPIIFVTGAVRRDEVRAHHGLIGGLTYLAKPIELTELVNCIEHLLATRSAPTRRTDQSSALIA